MLREAHPPDRRSTVAHFMQTSLSASSAFRPSASFPSPGTRLAWTTTKQRALLQSAPSEFDYHLLKKCNVSAYCLRLLHANAPTACQSVPAPAQAVEPTILMGAQVCRLCLKGHSPPMHGRCCDPTAIATSALLTHWQSRSLTRRLQASNLFLIDYTGSNLPGPAKGRQLNKPTTRPCSNHAYLPGLHIWQSLGPWPSSKCSKTVEIRCSC